MTSTPSDPRQLRSQMYGEFDLGGLSLFSGGFINYGYWPRDVDPRPSLADRTRSQAELYRQVARRLKPAAGDRLLELGCGKGAGAALLARECAPGLLLALDLSGPQLARAAAARPPGPVRLTRGSAQELPVADASLDGVYCVEAAQHMDDHDALARQARRVLRPGGRFVTAGFFAPEATDPGLAELLETVANGVDRVVPVAGFAAGLRTAGFGEPTVESIGERVWPGLDAWIAGTEFGDTWGRNWLPAYRNGWVDYYLVSAIA